MRLTKRDEALILDLNTYGLQRTRTIRDRHFTGVAMTTVLRRLRSLEEANYVQRIEGLPNAQVAWALTSKSAAHALPRASKIHFPRAIMEHDLKLADLRLALEEHGIARSWTSEHQVRSQMAKSYGLRKLSERNIPDGLMGVEIDGQRAMIAIEMELTAKNQTRYRRVLSDYSAKESLWAVWYVVHRYTIAKQIMRAAKDIGSLHQKPYLLFSVEEEVMKDPLQATVYASKGKYRVRDLWTPKEKFIEKETAHTDAQGVSSFSARENSHEKKLSA